MSISSRITSMEEHVTNAYNGLQGLGADLTGIDKNIENISMVLDDIYDSMPQVSGEGTSLTLDDTRVGKIKSTLKGNTSQTGTPTPSSPIPVNVVSGDNEINVNGKNLLDTIQPNVVNFTSNWGKSAMPLNNNLVLKAGSYTMSLDIKSASGKVFNKISFVDVDNNEYTWTIYVAIPTTYTSYNHTFTFNNDIVVKRIDYQNGGDGSETFYLNNIQLEKGSSATAYEPYQGNTYNIDLPVENLFDKDNANYVNGWIDSTTMRLNTNNGNRMFYISCKPNTTYTISRSIITSSFRATTYDSTPFPIATGSNVDYTVGSVLKNDNGTTLTITTGANAKYLVVHYGKTEDTNLNETLATIQVEYGSKQNRFTPYGTTPIELCSSKDGTLRDYFLHDRTLDKWYTHKETGKYVFNGTESGGQMVDNNQRIMFSSQNVPALLNVYIEEANSLANLTPSLCDYFQASSQSGLTPSNTKFAFSKWGETIFIYFSAIFNNVVDFKTWLSTHNTIVYYALKEPTNTEITYQPLIDQLNELEKAMSKDGQTNISQVNNDLPFIISASALKEWQESTSLNSTLSMVNPLSLGNTLNTQEIDNNTQPIEVDNIEPLEEEENEES